MIRGMAHTSKQDCPGITSFAMEGSESQPLSCDLGASESLRRNRGSNLAASYTCRVEMDVAGRRWKGEVVLMTFDWLWVPASLVRTQQA